MEEGRGQLDDVRVLCIINIDYSPCDGCSVSVAGIAAGGGADTAGVGTEDD